MSLQSPGVSVTLEDDSAYSATSSGGLQTVPLIVAAVQRNKLLSNGTVASGTTTAAANKLQLVTSKEDFRQKFGLPFFRNVNGVPIHGDETNEYGLHAAWNMLDSVNRAYVLPVDIDLEQLRGSATEPVREPEDGIHWLDLSRSRLGLFMWNTTTQAWERQDVYILNDTPGTGDVQPLENGAADPRNTFGLNGDFAIVASVTPMIVWQKIGGAWLMLGQEGHPNDFQMSPHTRVPRTRANGDPLQNGDTYIQVTSVNQGSYFDISEYEQASGNYVQKDTPILMQNDDALDYYAGQGGVQAGSVYVQMDNEGIHNPEYHYDPTRPQYSDGVAVFTPMVHSGEQFTATTSRRDVPSISLSSYPVSQVIINGVVVTFDTSTSYDGNVVNVEDMIKHLQNINDLKTQGLRFNLDGNRITIVHTRGYDITVENVGDVNVDWVPNTMTDIAAVLGFRYNVTSGVQKFRASNWSMLATIPSETQPVREAEVGTLWYATSLRAEILESYFDADDNRLKWRTVAWSEDQGGSGLPNSLIIRSSQPPLSSVNVGDIWLDSSDVENYPVLNRLTSQGWRKIDNTDQFTSDGIVFSNYSYFAPITEDGNSRDSSQVNEFAPSPDFYPEGILLFNMDYSTYNVKEYRGNGEWISVSGNRSDGSPFMGRKAQRNMIVRAMRTAITSSKELRAIHRYFNLLSAPGYVELLPELNALNAARKETGFVVSGLPLRMQPEGNMIEDWVNNENNAFQTGEDALLEFNRMSAVYGFSGLQSDTSGNMIAVPGDVIALDTIVRSDRQSYPWLAPAGYTRGQVFNTSALGYVRDNEFVVGEYDEGIIDTMYINSINPIVDFPGEGQYVWGQKTLQAQSTAMDRINVARLMAYIRYELARITRPFLFEPNDAQTRQEVQAIVESFLSDIVDKRGITDFAVQVDESNNPPIVVDANSLYIDCSIIPTKAVEFIFIPIRLLNTGEL